MPGQQCQVIVISLNSLTFLWSSDDLRQVRFSSSFAGNYADTMMIELPVEFYKNIFRVFSDRKQSAV